ncbi:MAG: FAD-dependent monooxygenase [Burkholderiales bacterium]|nr:FAD-dependent monooxygenase [Burkholderiales bacterium]
MRHPVSRHYDALVVGAGPAGAHLARLLARTGRRVAILDKQRFPREKVCGGGLSRKAIALLDLDIAPVPGAALESFGDRALFDFGAMPRGCGWIFPKHDHLNVGVYSPFGGTALRRHLDRFMDRHPALSGRQRIEYRGFVIPLRNEAGAFERGPVALIGDAAGLAEPIFGEGIYFALMSAALAAQAEIERDAGAAPMRYTQRLARELLPELRAAAWLARALFTFPEFTFRHLVCDGRANDLFAGLITGETGYRECLRRTLLASPRWLFRSAPRARQT